MIEHGVFFGMPEEQYFAIPALNASGMKYLRQSPLDFWARSWMNPRLAEVQEEEGTTEFKELGKAFDKRIIEGKAAFERCYVEKPECQFTYLKTADDLKEACRARELKVSGSKDELIARLEEADPGLPIWDKIVKAHAAEHDGKVFLDRKWMEKIAIAAAMIEKDPIFSKAFTGGMPQVTIVWRDETIGVDLKARPDYVKARAITDLKTYTNVRGLPLKDAVNREIASRRYFVQMAFYLEAVSQISGFIKDGRVFGECEPSFLKALAADHPKTAALIFQVKGVAPAVIGRVIPADSMMIQAAKAEIEAHKQTYRTYSETFGNLPWVTPASFEPLADEDIPPWAFA
jgi:hypothetical protein